MADFLTAVKTVSKQRSDTSDSGLTAVSTRPIPKKEPSTQRPQIDQALPVRTQARNGNTIQIETPADVLRVLKNEPDADAVLQVLSCLSAQNAFKDFSISSPGPLQAQMIHALITLTVPTFWATLDRKDQLKFASCLRNIAGVAAIVARLRLLANSDKSPESSAADIRDLLLCLQTILDGDSALVNVWEGLTQSVQDATKRKMSWKEFVNLTSSGKVVAAAAQAEDVLRSQDSSMETTWLSRGSEYATWLGRNLLRFLTLADEASQAAAQLFAKGLSLGYAQSLVKALISTAFSEGALSSLDSFVRDLTGFAKRQLSETILQWLSSLTSRAPATEVIDHASQSEQVSSIAALLSSLAQADFSLVQHVNYALVNPALSSSMSLTVRRACVTSVTEVALGELETLFERLQTTFSDQLFIDHAPILQQEAIAQTLLLVANGLHRSNPMAVLMISRSSGHMQGVSNRLHSSNERARWLGMVVGTVLSTLVDKQGSRMSFGTDDMQTSEAMAYGELAQLHDKSSNLTALKSLLAQSNVVRSRKQEQVTEKMPTLNGKPVFGPVRPPAQTEVIGEKVSEVFDRDGEESEEDDGLRPYAKPDSDPEDSDEDATLVTRNRPRPPVYIRDLMRSLRDDKDHDRFQIAIRNAPALIRRKANFGGEVTEHAEELALMLCDLQDPFETENFDELRLQGLIALLLSNVGVMAPWLSRQSFSGDYSIAQRCIMLSALGLGGRELAGFKDEYTGQTMAELANATTTFPSKRLPAHLDAMYNPTTAAVKRLEGASKEIEHAIMKPLALSAADQTTAHLNAVKVRTFSSRMEVERTKRKPAPNQLAMVFGDAFFSPLVTRYQQDIAAYGEASVFASSSIVIVTFIKTLALLLHASGPVTIGLSDITTVFWDLLLSLRTKASSDISILEAVLFSLLTILEINGEHGAVQRLAQNNPKHLMETQAWVEVIFERTGAGQLITEGGGEEQRVRTLAAGVLVKAREVIEAYQKALMGAVK